MGVTTFDTTWCDMRVCALRHRSTLSDIATQCPVAPRPRHARPRDACRVIHPAGWYSKSVMRRTWSWTFNLPPEELWPVLADTNRFNEAMGLPPYALEETPQPNGTVLRRGAGKAAGFTLEWEEKPYEWIAGRHFRQAREFTKGPFRRFGPVFDLEPDGAGGSRVSYALEYEPLTLMGRLFGARLAAQAGGVVEKRILEAVAFAKGERATFFDLPAPELPAGARERAAAMAGEIDRSPYGNGLGPRLAERVLAGMASDLMPLKPKRLARDLGVPQRAAIEACLAGVRAGLLTMKWDLLCTNCRGAKLSATALSELPRGAHCPSCNIDYDRDFEKNVELSFAPAPTVRPVMAGGFCLSGPMATPHVLVQLLLQPGERRRVDVDLPAGSYRVRTLHPGIFVDVEHAGGAFPGARIGALGVEAVEGREFVNEAGFELAALIEDRTWTREALTAPEVISLQVFRDLFAAAARRRGRGEPGGAAVLRPAGFYRALRAGGRFGGLQHGARSFRAAGRHRARPRWCGGQNHRRCRHGLVRRSGAGGSGGVGHAGGDRRPRSCPEDRRPCRGERGGDPERPARLFRLDREHGRPPARPERRRRHRLVAGGGRRSRRAAVAGGGAEARRKRDAKRLRPAGAVRAARPLRPPATSPVKRGRSWVLLLPRLGGGAPQGRRGPLPHVP
jgi:hypothetical protein